MKENDVVLIQRILDGDEGAFTALVKKYQKWVHTLVWRKIGDFHTAEEITQDIFLKVYKRLSTLKPPDRFPGWLYVIATRHCITWLRKKQLPTASLDAMPTTELEEVCYTQYEATHSEEVSLEHQRELVKRLLQKLPESERTVVTLYYLAEMTSEDISTFLGVSPNTIRSRLRRARNRLKKQEHLLHEVSGFFQVPSTLTENIMREIVRIKPTSPPVSKPWVPWGLSFASTFLVILMVGMGPRALSRFQQPYNLDATSEMTIELVDVPIVRELERKSDPLTQFGKTDTLDESSGSGFQSKSLLIAAAQADEMDISVVKPQWIQTKGPGGVSKPGLFLTSDQTLYAVAKTGLYHLTEKADGWTLISASGSNRQFDPVMAERGSTLYLLTPNEVLASTDRGKTWNTLGKRPNGHPIALVITDAPRERSPQDVDITMYLVLRTEVFRSEDGGRQWVAIGESLRTHVAPGMDDVDFRIHDAATIDNALFAGANHILFVGTSRGLFRFTDDWEKVTLPTSEGINSLASTENRLYVATIANPREGADRKLTASLFYSTNFGDSWNDITPNTDGHPFKLIGTVRVVPVGDTLMVIGPGGVLLSYDHGETWTDPGRDLQHAFTGGFLPVVALDENNFYKSELSGVTRSTDGGHSWHPFMTGLVSADVQSLIAGGNALYGVTGGKIAKSADGGESWETVNVYGGGRLLIPRIGTTDETLYVSSIAGHRTQLFHLPVEGDALAPVQGLPDFDEDNLYVEWRKRVKAARETNVNVRETERQWRESLPLIAEEDTRNGGFTLAGETVFMEHRRKLFRWRPGETKWHYTGLEDRGELPPIDSKGFTLAASGDIIYAGKREGDLFRSLDAGDTWNDVTENLAFPFAYFKEIVFAGSTVYISTDRGVMRSLNGEVWHALTDIDGNTRLIDRIATDGSTLYGVCDSGVYQVDNQTDTWKQVASEAPYTAISLAVDGNTLYIGTETQWRVTFSARRSVIPPATSTLQPPISIGALKSVPILIMNAFHFTS